METLTLKRRERLKTLTANALKTSAAVNGFSRDIEEQRKEIADNQAQIAHLREEIAMAQLSIEGRGLDTFNIQIPSPLREVDEALGKIKERTCSGG